MDGWIDNYNFLIYFLIMNHVLTWAEYIYLISDLCFIWIYIQKCNGRLYDSFIFEILRKLHIASHNSQTQLDSNQQFPGVLSSPDPESVCFIPCHFDDGHFKRGEVISCYSFDSIFLLRRHLSSIMSINQKGAKREKCRALQIYQELNISCILE